MITVGENIEGETNTVCVQDGGDVSKKTKIISDCEPSLQGRYIHVKLPNRGHVTICEIEVYEGNLQFFLNFSNLKFSLSIFLEALILHLYNLHYCE